MGIAKRARTSAGRQLATFRRSATMSARYNRRMSGRMQRAPGVSSETGFLDISSSTYPMDTTGTVALLSAVPQGASVNQRVGKKIALKSLQCRGQLANNSAAIANDVAYMVVYDKRPTGALPAVTDILASANAQAMNNDANSGRFVVLKRTDEILLGNTAAVGNLTERSTLGCDFYLNLKNMPTVYKAAGTGGIGDTEQGALYFVTVGNAVAGTSAAIVSCTFRLRFQDI